MLILSRKETERIVIDNGRIVITVVQCKNGKVRLGFEASPEVQVNREEVQRRIDGWRPRDRRA
jgi:carbon storage regulator